MVDKPDTETYIVQAARVYRKTEKAKIAATPDKKEQAQNAHRHAKRAVSRAVDLADAKVKS